MFSNNDDNSGHNKGAPGEKKGGFGGLGFVGGRGLVASSAGGGGSGVCKKLCTNERVVEELRTVIRVGFLTKK